MTRMLRRSGRRRRRALRTGGRLARRVPGPEGGASRAPARHRSALPHGHRRDVRLLRVRRPAAQRATRAADADRRLITPVMQLMFDPNRPEGVGYPGSDQYKPMTDPAARASRGWTSVGIAYQHVISGAGYTLARAIDDPALGRRALEAVNTWMTDAAADHLEPDPAGHVAAVRRPRLGRRRAHAHARAREPRVPRVGRAGRRHPAHAPRLRQGVGGRDRPRHDRPPARRHEPRRSSTRRGRTPTIPAIIRLISLQNPHHSAQVFLTAVVFGGVFERHPNLTVLVSELGIDWFPGWVNKVDSMAAPGVSPLVVGDYRWPLTPREYIERNVRISPIPAPHESPLPLMEQRARRGRVLLGLPPLRGQSRPARVLRARARRRRRRRRGSSSSAARSPTSYARMGDPV